MTVKEYINHYTRDCSNEGRDGLFIPWLTPDNARIAAMMAREEVIEQACEWLKNAFKNDDYIIDGLDFYKMIEDFKQAIKGE